MMYINYVIRIVFLLGIDWKLGHPLVDVAGENFLELARFQSKFSRFSMVQGKTYLFAYILSDGGKFWKIFSCNIEKVHEFCLELKKFDCV